MLVHLFDNFFGQKENAVDFREPACTADQVNKAFLCNADEGVIRPPLSLRKDQRRTHAALCLPDILRRIAAQMRFVSRSKKFGCDLSQRYIIPHLYSVNLFRNVGFITLYIS